MSRLYEIDGNNLVNGIIDQFRDELEKKIVEETMAAIKPKALNFAKQLAVEITRRSEKQSMAYDIQTNRPVLKIAFIVEGERGND